MNGKLIGIYIYVLKHICIKNVKNNYIFNKNHFIK